MMFAECWRNMLEGTNNLDFYQDSVIIYLIIHGNLGILRPNINWFLQN